MDKFTYETEDRNSELEQMEWDNVWWEQTSNSEAARVLYIGDSISCGIRHIATERSNGKYLFDGFGTSKAVDNAYFASAVSLFAKQQQRRKIVIFNNGLHGFHLDDTKEYKEYYEKQVQFLLEEFKGTPVALVLSTYVVGEDHERVIARNNGVREIGGKYNLPIIDLYTTSAEYKHLQIQDGVHYTTEGYEKMAEKLLEFIEEILSESI